MRNGHYRRRKKKTPEQKAAQQERREQIIRSLYRICGRKVCDQAKRRTKRELSRMLAESELFVEEGRGFAPFENEDLRNMMAKKNKQQYNYRNGHVYRIFLRDQASQNSAAQAGQAARIGQNSKSQPDRSSMDQTSQSDLSGKARSGGGGDHQAEPQYISIYKLHCRIFHDTLKATLDASDLVKDKNRSELREIYDTFEKFVNDMQLPARSRVFSMDSFISALRSNPRYRDLKVLNAEREILNEIPDDITELFPLARSLERHFIIHVGDTNSGKTYQAIEDMKTASTGVYLAPLRLLALEIQEKLLGEGVVCSLLTGEEEDIIENSTHMASTVEMLNLDYHYEVCVIDEAQMIDEEQRGWAWTKAILGACADRIHVCMSENALEIVQKLIDSCGDTCEVIRHTRNTPLIFEEEEFAFPEGIQKHDALIVFSRKKVLWVAAELEKNNINASVIYGSLPYSVRKNEISKFVSGKTDVVVSTDAIGMGMNLPVRRIVFLESSKFDGRGSRFLRGPEVKQIAGRAGRRGLYETGYVNAYYDSDMIQYALEEPYDYISKARIQMPERLLDLDMTLSETIYNWNNIANDQLYKKADVSILLKKCDVLEELDGLSKKEMWRFALIPFDERNKVLWKIWKRLVYDYYNMEPLDIDKANSDLSEGKTLGDLETDYKILDLYFSFSRAINYNENDFRYNITLMKDIISERIIKELRNISGERKRCRECGRPLVWDSRHDLCRDCARKARARRFGSR